MLEDQSGIVLFGKRMQVIRSITYRLLKYLNSDAGEQELRPPEYGKVGSLVKGWNDVGTLLEDLRTLLLLLSTKAAEEGPIVCHLEDSDVPIEYNEGELDGMYWQLADARRYLWKQGLTETF